MTTLSDELRAYYRDVADILPCAGREKRRYLKELRNRLCDLQLEQPAADRKTACEIFGTAEEIGESWLESLSVCDLKRQTGFSRRAKALIVVIAAAVVIGLALLGRFYLKYQEAVFGEFIAIVETGEVPPDATDEDLREIEAAAAQRADDVYQKLFGDEKT